MLIPCISRPPSYISGYVLERYTHLLEHKVGERKVRVPTAQEEWVCSACLKGKHRCVSKRCVCSRCRVAA